MQVAGVSRHSLVAMRYGSRYVTVQSEFGTSLRAVHEFALEGGPLSDRLKELWPLSVFAYLRQRDAAYLVCFSVPIWCALLDPILTELVQLVQLDYVPSLLERTTVITVKL